MSHTCNAQLREDEATRSQGTASTCVEDIDTFRSTARRKFRGSAANSILPLCLGIFLSATSCAGWSASFSPAVVSSRSGRSSLLQLHASSRQRDAGGTDGPMRRNRNPRPRTTGATSGSQKPRTPGRRGGRDARSPGVNAAGAVLEGEQLSLTTGDYPGRTLDHVPGTWKKRPTKATGESLLDVTRNAFPRNGARLNGGSVLPVHRSIASEAMEVVNRIAEEVEKGSNLKKTVAARREFQERSTKMAKEMLELDLEAECFQDNCDVDDDVDNDTSYIPFRGGWAETFPSMVTPGKPDGARSNIRIPFLFGTRRGCRASMAILAPPEATSLYQRIPFLTGSRRLPGGMGEDSTTLIEEEEAVALAKAKTEAAVRSLQKQREQKGEDAAERIQKGKDERKAGELRGKAGLLAASKAEERARERGGRVGGGRVAPANEPALLDTRSICKDMQLREGGRRVVKTGGLDRASFILWSDSYDAGESEWTVRIDTQTGVIFVGCMVDPTTPQEGFARNLATPAWMIGSYGYVCRTGPNGQMSLTDQAKEQIGDPTVGALAFGAGSVIRMRLDRDRGVLAFQVDGKPAFKLGGVDARARPFLNIAFEGDAASLLRPNDTPHVDAAAQESSSSETMSPTALTQEELQRLRAEADDFWS